MQYLGVLTDQVLSIGTAQPLSPQVRGGEREHAPSCGLNRRAVTIGGRRHDRWTYAHVYVRNTCTYVLTRRMLSIMGERELRLHSES